MSDAGEPAAAGIAPFPRLVETPHFVLRPYRRDDAEVLAGAVAGESDRLREVFAEPVLALRSRADAEALIERLGDDWRVSGQFVIPVWDKRTGALAGECYLGRIDPVLREACIGIFLLAEFEGRGMGREALGAVMIEAGRTMGLALLHYRCDVDNHRSCRLALASGFDEGGERGTTRTRRDGLVVETRHFRCKLPAGGRGEGSVP